MASRKRARKSKPRAQGGEAAVTKFLSGRIVDRHLAEMLLHSLSLQMLVRTKPEPQPSRGPCTPQKICTVTILCMITKGGDRITCGKTQIFNPKCPVIPKL